MQKLELTWIGKDEEIRVEPRILLNKKELDYGDTTTGNMLIHGDNLLALKALEQDFTGRVKCIYIDPPYNTGAAFEHYDDNLEHSTWLNLMYHRLKILHSLLAKDGFIFVQIDDNEHCYLKLLLDEIFGRNNFVADLIWRKKSGGGQDSQYFAIEHEYILVFKKNNGEIINQSVMPQIEDYTHTVNGKKAQLLKLEKWGTSAHRIDRPTLYYAIKDPDGNDFFPIAPDGKDGRWRKKPESLDENHIFWQKRNGKWKPYEVLYFDEAKPKQEKIRSILLEDGNNTEATNEIKGLFGFKTFDTPKPEKLIKKIIEATTNENDLVLDSFLGSGTTAAVAHKMNRRYIGIEMGEHAYTHAKVRLDRVIDGEDNGGVSAALGWTGGGGYKFYELAPTLIVKDKHGNQIFSDKYNAACLAAAVAKINGFRYAPDDKTYWKQGKSDDNCYIFVTTEYLTAKKLDEIAEEVSDFEHLLICAPAFDLGLNKRYGNIEIRKIPMTVLEKCEYGVDNYNLNIINPPTFDEEEFEDA